MQPLRLESNDFYNVFQVHVGFMKVIAETLNNYILFRLIKSDFAKKEKMGVKSTTRVKDTRLRRSKMSKT